MCTSHKMSRIKLSVHIGFFENFESNPDVGPVLQESSGSRYELPGLPSCLRSEKTHVIQISQLDILVVLTCDDSIVILWLL